MLTKFKVLTPCFAALAVAQGVVFFQLENLTFRHANSATQQKYLLETMGGGVAVFDFNNDGRLDLFFVNGGHLADPQGTPADFRRTEPRYWNRLYRQETDGRFSDATEAAGLSRGPNQYGMGVAVGDYDNDGFADLYVTGYPRNVLYRNQGDGRFAEVTAGSGTEGKGWSASAGFFDYDRDGRLDLFVTRYLDWQIEKNILCGTPFHAYCKPDRFPAIGSYLFHNEGGGRFKDVSRETGISARLGKGLGVSFADYDADGWLDIFVANDGMEQFLWHNEAGKAFQEVGLESGVALADDGKSFAGMGTAFADFDRDGRPDVLVTNLALEKYALFRNEGGEQFRYASLQTGLASLTARSSGWGVALEDFDNDGWRDIFVAQGHVLDNVEKIHSGLRYLETPALLLGGEGRFRAGTLSAPAAAGRGLAWGDLDNDGDLDVVVSTLSGTPWLFRNVAPRRHWLSLALKGSESNREGVGTEVRVEGQSAWVSRAGSYLSASDPRVHFGFGEDKRAEVRVEVRWPSGKRQVLDKVKLDQILKVEEPE